MCTKNTRQTASKTILNCCQFMYLVISLLVLRAGCGIWLFQFLIIAYHFTFKIRWNTPKKSAKQHKKIKIFFKITKTILESFGLACWLDVTVSISLSLCDSSGNSCRYARFPTGYAEEMTIKCRPGPKLLIRSLCGELFDYTLSMLIELLAFGQRYINITRNAIGPKSGQKDCRKF